MIIGVCYNCLGHMWLWSWLGWTSQYGWWQQHGYYSKSSPTLYYRRTRAVVKSRVSTSPRWSFRCTALCLVKSVHK